MPEQKSDQPETPEQLSPASLTNTTSLAVSRPSSDQRIIWTPRFTIIFALLLALGLCTASLLARLYLNDLLSANWLAASCALIGCLCWTITGWSTQSTWIRIGCIPGFLWSLLTGISYLQGTVTWSLTLQQNTYLIAAANGLLLLSFLCLANAHIEFNLWDRWFYRLVPIIAVLLIAILFFALPQHTHAPLTTLASIVAFVELGLAAAIWWLRPACWQKEPGLVILLGCIPLWQLCCTGILPLQLLPFIAERVNREATVFMVQLMWLSLWLGTLRMLQKEKLY